MDEKDQPTEAATLALFDATIKWEHAAIRALYLLNGGALVAVLTFAGNVFGGEGTKLASAMVLPIRVWVVGLALAAIASMAAFFSQQAFYKREGRRWARRIPEAEQLGEQGVLIRRVAYFCAAASLISFIIGGWLASAAFEIDVSVK